MSMIDFLKNNIVKIALIINLIFFGIESIDNIRYYALQYGTGTSGGWILLIWPSIIVPFSILGLFQKKWPIVFSIFAAMICYILLMYLNISTALHPMEQERSSGVFLNIILLLNVCIINVMAFNYVIKPK